MEPTSTLRSLYDQFRAAVEASPDKELKTSLMPHLEEINRLLSVAEQPEESQDVAGMMKNKASGDFMRKLMGQESPS